MRRLTVKYGENSNESLLTVKETSLCQSEHGDKGNKKWLIVKETDYLFPRKPAYRNLSAWQVKGQKY